MKSGAASEAKAVVRTLAESIHSTETVARAVSQGDNRNVDGNVHVDEVLLYCTAVPCLSLVLRTWRFALFIET